MGLRPRVELRYYIAETASGQDGRDFPSWSREENFSIWPYNESLIDQACSIKMAVYWPCPFFAFLLTTTSSRPKKKSKKELGQYPRQVNCDNYRRVIMWQSEDFLVAR